jgi:adenine-specific DNA-methyltransferase
MTDFVNTDSSNLFLDIEESLEYLKEVHNIQPDKKDIKILVEFGILPKFISGSKVLILKHDLASVLPILKNKNIVNFKLSATNTLFEEPTQKFVLDKNTIIALPDRNTKIERVFYSAIRNLISTESSYEQVPLTDVPYFSTTQILTTSKAIIQLIEEQRKRANLIESLKSNQFANSAYYMGSKRALSAFLAESLVSTLPTDGIIVDLMCGSGAAASAFNTIWRTLASDAQEFCRILALVQGGGYSVGQAQNLRSQIIPLARENTFILQNLLGMFIEEEDAIFHSDIGTILLNRYRRFIESFPTYPNGKARFGWDPFKEVEQRKKNSAIFPYCLFTSYFSNVYFGLRQCIEIDSLRYAIDKIKNEKERLWALGALVATMSAVGTSYAGHFAQPVILNDGNLAKIIETRSYSIMHEFSIRLLRLSEEAEKTSNQIEIIPGPWTKAITELDDRLSNNQLPVAVYVDAPYKRDEYSRYYHILETVVLYSYPSCVGNGKIPNKIQNERFQSEFFTRSETKLNEIFVNLFCEVLRRGWIVAWSYSETGIANIVNVVNEVSKITGCEVKSYSAPYQHKAQSGSNAKNVTEYLIICEPKS